jgi:DNA mismatch repair protein MSH3
LSQEAFVANDIHLSSDGSGPRRSAACCELFTGLRGMVITGPNMGGKSSYIRAMAIIAVMCGPAHPADRDAYSVRCRTQVGSFVPADRVEMTPLDAVYTRMGARDDITQGQRCTFVAVAPAGEIALP